MAAIYDGDTPDGQRRKLRQKPPPILISNPDMLHAGHLRLSLGLGQLPGPPQIHSHRRGARLSRGVRQPRVRRAQALLRLAAARGSRPGFVLSSATIANPGEHAQPPSPAGPSRRTRWWTFAARPAAGRSFALVNPSGAASTTASYLVATAVKQGLATICFTKSRIHTELIHTWVTRSHPELRDMVAGYRAGFLPEERRRIEAGPVLRAAWPG